MKTFNKEELKAPPRAMIAGNLAKLLASIKEEDSIRIIDALSEWALPFSKDKHIVELLEEKITYAFERNTRKITALRSYVNSLFKNYESPEKFIVCILGDEFDYVKERISRRSYKEGEFAMNIIHEEFGKSHKAVLDSTPISL